MVRLGGGVGEVRSRGYPDFYRDNLMRRRRREETAGSL